MSDVDLYATSMMKSMTFGCHDFRQVAPELAGGDDVTPDPYQLTTLETTPYGFGDPLEKALETPYDHHMIAGRVGFYHGADDNRELTEEDHLHHQHDQHLLHSSSSDTLNAAMITCGLPLSASGMPASLIPTMTSPQKMAVTAKIATTTTTSPSMLTSSSCSENTVTESPPGGGHAGHGEGVGYDHVMLWLNQQSCGGTVKRKRKINRRQRLAANQRERRRMVSMNSAFEELRRTIPTLPYEKKLSRIQTLRFAMDYIGIMADILRATPPEAETEVKPKCQQQTQLMQQHCQQQQSQQQQQQQRKQQHPGCQWE